MSKKVILFSPFIHPELISTGKYNTHLAKALARLGYSVEVVASHPLYPKWKPEKTEAILDNVKIFRGGGWIRYSKSMLLRRIQLELWFMCFAVRHLLFKNKTDIVIPVFPPMLFFLVIKYFFSKTVRKVGIVHDIQGVMAGLSQSPSKKLIVKAIQLLEKKIFDSCDKLIFVSRSMADKVVTDYGIDSGKINVSYPFVSLEKKEIAGNLTNLFPEGFRHIVYSGAIGEKQNPNELLNFFQAVVFNREDIMCHMFSRGPLFDDLKNAVNMSSDRIRFHDLVSEENLYELYLHSDIQIIPQKEGTSEGAIPSKLPNILSSGVPVFLIGDTESDLSKLIKESGIGCSAGSWDIDRLVDKLNKFLEDSSSLTHQERREIVSEVIEQYFGLNQLVQLIIS